MAEQQESLFEQIEDPISDDTIDLSGDASTDWPSLGERFSEALQYPSTMVPLFVAAVALMFIVLVLPWFSTSLLRAVVVAGLLAGACSFGWFYFLRYEEEHRKKTQKRTEHQIQVKRAREARRLQVLKATLLTGFTNIESLDGERALTRLANEFDQLQSLIKGWPDSSLVSISQIQVLAEQTYRQGLNVLSGVLDLLLAIEVTDERGLATDVQALVTEIEELQHEDSQAARLEIRRAMLSEMRGRLERLSVQELRAEEFLLKSSLIEGSLNRTRMELASLKVDSSEIGDTEVSEALEKTIDSARSVLDEMRELGF